ncbi:hypothetical protein CRI94_09915 [Longibacter salinarum]|uniref:Peptidase S24/S26A/S26B/S26C domain-containing protein n=1 Tax=Longibacter salinarum TaxID=1850348 RepID=A0A2A8CYD8_9BACT|nr:S24 family peptidase [Longibacter salinarum]PEN13614.1 hypothetical protein CRI94_09915 [Longibacter salinarum]
MFDASTQIDRLLGPTPEDSQEEFRAFLRRVVAEQFDGNVSKMTTALAEVGDLSAESKQANLRRKLSRFLSYSVRKIDSELIMWTWTYLFDKLGLQAFEYAPDLLGSRLLPVIRFSTEPVEEQSALPNYRTRPQVTSRYSIDNAELDEEHRWGDRHYFVTIAETDALEPELRAGDRVIVEHVEDTTMPASPGVYLLRIESSVQFARLQPREDEYVDVLFPNSSHKNYTLRASNADIEILGRVWGSYRRT